MQTKQKIENLIKLKYIDIDLGSFIKKSFQELLYSQQGVQLSLKEEIVEQIFENEDSVVNLINDLEIEIQEKLEITLNRMIKREQKKLNAINPPKKNKFELEFFNGAISDQYQIEQFLDPIQHIIELSNNRLAINDSSNKILIFDWEYKKIIKPKLQDIQCMIYIQHEDLLVFGGEDGMILAYDKNFILKYNLYEHDEKIDQILEINNYSGNQKQRIIKLISCTQDKKIKIWDLKKEICDGQMILEQKAKKIFQVNYKIIGAVDENDQVTLWNFKRKILVRKFKVYEGPNRIFQYLGQNLLLISTTSYITILNFSTGVLKINIRGYVKNRHVSEIIKIINIDNKHVLTVSQDFSFKIWEIDHQNLEMNMVKICLNQDSNSIQFVTILSNSRILSSQENLIYMWD